MTSIILSHRTDAEAKAAALQDRSLFSGRDIYAQDRSASPLLRCVWTQALLARGRKRANGTRCSGQACCPGFGDHELIISPEMLRSIDTSWLLCTPVSGSVQRGDAQDHEFCTLYLVPLCVREWALEHGVHLGLYAELPPLTPRGAIHEVGCQYAALWKRYLANHPWTEGRTLGCHVHVGVVTGLVNSRGILRAGCTDLSLSAEDIVTAVRSHIPGHTFVLQPDGSWLVPSEPLWPKGPWSAPQWCIHPDCLEPEHPDWRSVDDLVDEWVEEYAPGF